MKLPVLLALASAASAADMFPFQLPWDDASPSITNIAWLNDKPAGRDGFVHVKDGHLFAGEKRLRIFGVNMCFAANFPKHEDADKIAARLAKFGINCVRFHHMDMFSAPAGIFEKDGRTLDAGQLDKLDYFIAALKKHGIYANLNLHVSRTYPDLPKAEKKGSPQFDKGVDNFHAPMIALQKTYARDLLTHVNKYTGNAYAVEPAVALVEINNENALGFQWFAREMDDLPSIYREDLEMQWGAWILKKHGSDDNARKAWSEGAQPQGEELLSYRSGDIPVADSVASKGATPVRTAVPVGDKKVAAPIRWTFNRGFGDGVLVVRREAKRHAAFGRGFGGTVPGFSGNFAAFQRNLLPFLFDGRLTKAVSSLRSATALQGSAKFMPQFRTFWPFSATFNALSETFLASLTTGEASLKTFLPFLETGSAFSTTVKAFAKNGSVSLENGSASATNGSAFLETGTAFEGCECVKGSCLEDRSLFQEGWGRFFCAEGAAVSSDVLQKTSGISFNFETHGVAMAKGSMQKGVVSVVVDEPGTELWHVQFTLGQISLKPGSYEVKFRVKGPVEGQVSVGLQQTSSPWKVLGSGNVKMGTEWGDRSVIISVGSAEEKARLTIGGMGLTEGHYEFSDFSLRSVGIEGGLVRDAKGRVPMVKKRELSKMTPAKQRDWQEFMWDTELVYWNGMRDFLKKDLGVRAPIVGTQGAWSPGHVQSGMDVIDSHAYWQHPDFEGGEWNPERWTVNNIPMSGAKDGGTLPGLAAQRVKGKPFICTEYNHSAPNTYGAETAPIIAAFAALQDWDGVFLFAYSHNDKWQQEHFDSFFDIARHPVKMATLPGAVLSFRRGDFLYLPGYETAYISENDVWKRALSYGPSLGLAHKAQSMQAHQKKIDVALMEENHPFRLRGRIGLGEVMKYEWTDAQRMTLDSPGYKAAIGYFDGRTAFEFGKQRLDQNAKLIITPKEGWACFQITSMEQEYFPKGNLDKDQHILITATGSIENTKMGWKNEKRTTVGRDWGMPPVLVEGPKATIALPGGGRFKAWALDERGQRREEVPVRDAKLEIGPQFKTLWYEVERL